MVAHSSLLVLPTLRQVQGWMPWMSRNLTLTGAASHVSFFRAVRFELISVWFYIGCGLVLGRHESAQSSMTVQKGTNRCTRAEHVPRVCVQAEGLLLALRWKHSSASSTGAILDVSSHLVPKHRHSRPDVLREIRSPPSTDREQLTSNLQPSSPHRQPRLAHFFTCVPSGDIRTAKSGLCSRRHPGPPPRLVG